MTHTTTQNIKNAHTAYEKSTDYNLYHCYNNHSYAKEKAWNYCVEQMIKHNGSGLKVIGYNSMTFSVGFYGEINGKSAFFYITKSYDRFIYLDELYTINPITGEIVA